MTHSMARIVVYVPEHPETTLFVISVRITRRRDHIRDRARVNGTTRTVVLRENLPPIMLTFLDGYG